MPVQFLCQICRTKLSIARRKIGTPIECPKCRALLTVPDEDTASAGLAMAVAIRDLRKKEKQPQATVAEFVVFDEPPPPEPSAPLSSQGEESPDRPATTAPKQEKLDRKGPNGRDPTRRDDEPPHRSSPTMEEPPVSPSVSKPPRRSKATGRKAPRSRRRKPASKSPTSLPTIKESEPRRRAIVAHKDWSMLLVSRRAVYFQGVLFVGLGIFFFAAGYLIGRGVGPVDLAENAGGRGDAVLLQGQLEYTAAGGEIKPDEGAVVLALPLSRFPNPKLPVHEIGPLSPAPDDGARVLLALEDIGGRYARADAAGEYSLVVPEPGEYRLVFISRHAERPVGSAVDEIELNLLRRYFTPAPALIGRQSYVMQLAELTDGMVRKSHHFRAGG